MLSHLIEFHFIGYIHLLCVFISQHSPHHLVQRSKSNFKKNLLDLYRVLKCLVVFFLIHSTLITDYSGRWTYLYSILLWLFKNINGYLSIFGWNSWPHPPFGEISLGYVVLQYSEISNWLTCSWIYVLICCL